MKNNLASIMNLYMTRNSDDDQPLSKVLAVMNIDNAHFVQTTIDFTDRTVTTRDSIKKAKDYASLRRKWVAKLASISQHFIMGGSPKEVYLGSMEMKFGDTFTATDVPKLIPN